MERQFVAYLVIVLLIAGAIAAVTLSQRYARYQRALRFGHEETKPVRRPFWLP